MKKLVLLILLIPNIAFSGSISDIGEKGSASEIDKVIEIKMYDNYFEPNQINILKGQTIKFIVLNLGDLVHEFNIATKKMHSKHQLEMIKMIEHGILLGDKIDYEQMKKIALIDHSMAHSHSNSILLEPNMSGEIIWKFNTNAVIEAACNIPGHYESGMVAKINNL
tara:strand:+ start:990 stop:1487 length:498 start_codon:yes stop_codon:yes gene_type:complete